MIQFLKENKACQESIDWVKDRNEKQAFQDFETLTSKDGEILVHALFVPFGITWSCLNKVVFPRLSIFLLALMTKVTSMDGLSWDGGRN